MKISPFLAPLLLCATLAAQNYTVSPGQYTSTSGNSNNTIPFWSATHRYQQIHGDMQGAPRVMLGMSLRKAAITLSSGVARSSDVTILMCDSNIASASTTFASNYIGTPTTVLPKTTINLPDWTSSQGTPEPWTVVIPFRVPWPYTGVNDLMWEWVIDATTATSTYAADACSQATVERRNGAIGNNGSGCVATGNTATMKQALELYTLNTTNTLNLPLTTINCPASVAGAILVGPTNPALSVPGLCERVYSDGLWTFGAGSNASGVITLPAVSTAHNNAWVGLSLYVQTIAVDVGQSGLPFALSQGQQGTIPSMPPTGGAAVQRIWSNSNSATTGSRESYPYGLIVRFTHS
jgi:hypothetical protein